MKCFPIIFAIISCSKCTVNSKFHLIRRKSLPTKDFELTVPDLYSFYKKDQNTIKNDSVTWSQKCQWFFCRSIFSWLFTLDKKWQQYPLKFLDRPSVIFMNLICYFFKERQGHCWFLNFMYFNGIYESTRQKVPFWCTQDLQIWLLKGPTIDSNKSRKLQYHYRLQRSWGKIIFLQACVILFTGVVCLSACWDSNPPPKTRHPPRPGTPPKPGTPQDQAPPKTRHPPKPGTPIAKHAGRYGHRAGGIHPNGMQSCS